MKERPILFRGEMVRAILAGSKTQTRRMFDKKRARWFAAGGWERDTDNWPMGMDDGGDYVRASSPFGHAGDRLWVRETWMEYERTSEEERAPRGGKPLNPFVKIIYRADYKKDPCPGEWRPSIFMRREQCRLRLGVLKIRVERLDDITEDDAIAEGCDAGEDKASGMDLFRMPGHKIGDKGYASPEIAYCAAFRAMHKLAPTDNPWLWVVEFKRTPFQQKTTGDSK